MYPKAKILGHRDLPGVRKACPCFDVRKWWERLWKLREDGSALQGIPEEAVLYDR